MSWCNSGLTKTNPWNTNLLTCMKHTPGKRNSFRIWKLYVAMPGWATDAIWSGSWESLTTRNTSGFWKSEDFRSQSFDLQFQVETFVQTNAVGRSAWGGREGKHWEKEKASQCILQAFILKFLHLFLSSCHLSSNNGYPLVLSDWLICGVMSCKGTGLQLTGDHRYMSKIYCHGHFWFGLNTR